MLETSFDPPEAVVTLNRPEARNALSPELMDELFRALDEIEARGDLAAVILTGAGKAFCAGLDLKVLREMAGQPPEKALEDAQRLMNLLRRLYTFPLPVIAAVNGAAVGGGCGLITVCDLVLAVEEAPFGYTEVRLGFVPALVSVFLVRICGERRARDLLLSGRFFSAREALEFGLVNEIVPRDTLLERATEWVGVFSQNSPSALQRTKEMLAALPELSLEQALLEAARLNVEARSTPDFQEGVRAFLEKRPPRWRKR